MLKTIKILDNVYTISDSYNNYSNLVIGNKKALLLDTGLGLDDLKSEIRKLTDLPLIVINSHGHFDHIGGNYQFDLVYLNSKDKVVLEHYNKELLEDWLKAITKTQISLSETYSKYFNTKDLNFKSFDLGNLECFIVELPGHTKGSIGIYIPKLKLLLSGDALLPIITLNFDNHAGLKEELNSLENIKNLNFDYYLTGHSEKLYPKSLIGDLLKCLKNSQIKKHYYYKYPGPPYSPGYFYVDSVENEPVGVILSCEEYLSSRKD